MNPDWIHEVQSESEASTMALDSEPAMEVTPYPHTYPVPCVGVYAYRLRSTNQVKIGRTTKGGARIEQGRNESTNDGLLEFLFFFETAQACGVEASCKQIFASFLIPGGNSTELFNGDVDVANIMQLLTILDPVGVFIDKETVYRVEHYNSHVLQELLTGNLQE